MRVVVYKYYEIRKKPSGQIQVYKRGEYVGDGNNLENLRNISKGLDIDVKVGDTTRSLGNKVIKALETQ